jgi:UDP-N-acetylglucosamine--dolichyl-phosphate N-acetylglucosaminephosphotransferase
LINNNTLQSGVAMYELALAGMLALLATLMLTPRWIERAKRTGLVGRDMNKYSKPKIAEAGGIVVFTAFLLGMLVILGSYWFMDQPGLMLMTAASVISISIITVIAYTDDVSGWKKGFVRWKKPLITAVAVLPLIPFLLDRVAVYILGYQIGLPWLFYPLVMVPIGFIVATNAVNLLGGFNGLESTLAITGIVALMWFTRGTEFFPMLLVAAASIAAFLWFNRYPSRVFPGDTLTYFVGALFAVVAVMGNFQSITVLIMAPWILEGAIKSREIHYIFRNKQIFKPECFGIPSRDGSLKPPYPQIWSLTHIAMRLIRRIRGLCFENDVTILITGLYALWCLGLVWLFG